jgi:hypothetical protein
VDVNHILVVDTPANATAAEVEQMLNEPYGKGYFLQAVACGLPGSGSRAVFRLRAQRDLLVRKSDGKDGRARAFIQANVSMTVTALMSRLAALGIKRGKTWVTEARLSVRGARCAL